MGKPKNVIGVGKSWKNYNQPGNKGKLGRNVTYCLITFCLIAKINLLRILSFTLS